MGYRDEIDVDELIDEDDKKTGRPREYTEELADMICESVQLGMTFKDSANLAGVKEKTAGAWKNRHPYFATAYARAKLKRKQVLIATVRSAAKKDWRAAFAMLQALYPEEWAKQKLLAMVKRTDKAGELVGMIFSEAQGIDGPDDPELAAAMMREVAEGQQLRDEDESEHDDAIDVLPTTVSHPDDSAGTDDHSSTDGPAA